LITGESLLSLLPGFLILYDRTMIEKIVKRDGRIVSFDRSKITMAILQAAIAVGGRDRLTAERVTGDVIEHLKKHPYRGTYPTVEEIQDLVEKSLIERGHAKTAKAYIVYRYEHALKRKGKESLTYSKENIPYQKLWQTLSWCVDHNCVTLSQINSYIHSNNYRKLVNLSEEFYQKEIEEAFLKLSSHLDTVKLAVMAGPSSSGKTTTTIKLAEKLESIGYSVILINADNYFFDLEEPPKDSLGDYDFETPQAIDLNLLQSHLLKLLEGRPVQMPSYNFKKGKREGLLPPVRLKDKSMVLLDSLHGLHDSVTGHIPNHAKFNLYIETLSQHKDSKNRFIRWADIRMLRRMVRDMQFRNYSPEQTVTHWHYVRRSELRYIVSQLHKANAIINSYLAYELPVLKNRLHDLLPQFYEKFQKNSELEDALSRVERVTRLFKEIESWGDESIVPQNSVLREFIGGGKYP
jgi:uridine kinase